MWSVIWRLFSLLGNAKRHKEKQIYILDYIFIEDILFSRMVSKFFGSGLLVVNMTNRLTRKNRKRINRQWQIHRKLSLYIAYHCLLRNVNDEIQ